MIVKFLKLLICIILIFSGDVNSQAADTEGNYTLKTGVSLIEQVPNTFYGSWRVVSKIIETNSPQKFRQGTIDLWNLSREGDVINLNNPFTGAAASLTVNHVSKNSIKFTRVGNYDNQRLTDIVELKLNGDTFTGTNILYLETISDINGEVMKSLGARYTLKGQKISGMSVLGK